MEDYRAQIRRWECPEHGNTLSVTREHAPHRYCITHGDFIEPVEVTYVRGDDHQGAVERIDALRRTQDKYDPSARTADEIRTWNAAFDAALLAVGGR